MGDVVVTKLPISFLVGIFIFYLLSHTSIVLMYKYMLKNKDVEENGKKMFSEKELKITKFLSSWYHLIYVVVAIFLIYVK